MERGTDLSVEADSHAHDGVAGRGCAVICLLWLVSRCWRTALKRYRCNVAVIVDTLLLYMTSRGCNEAVVYSGVLTDWQTDRQTDWWTAYAVSHRHVTLSHINLHIRCCGTASHLATACTGSFTCGRFVTFYDAWISALCDVGCCCWDASFAQTQFITHRRRHYLLIYCFTYLL